LRGAATNLATAPAETTTASDATTPDTDRERARALILRFGWNAAAYQILNPGIRLWFAAEGDAVAGYAAHSRTWVVAGAPVCAPDRIAAVSEELERDAHSRGARVVYFGAGSRLERAMSGTDPHRPLLLGAQPVWDAVAWPAIVRSKSSLRAQINRARNKGVAVVEWPPDVARHHPVLERVLDEWLATRGLPPLHFMTEPHTLGDLRDRRVFVAGRDPDEVVAFLVATPVPARKGWLIEQWPRSGRAPNGTTQLLIDAAMRTLGDAGARYVTLGLAPLSDRAGAVGDGQSTWLRFLLRWIRAHGRRFYNFRGLDAFKAGLEPPMWEPVYAVTRGRRIGLRELHAIAGVFSGGSPERLVLTALGQAAIRELRTARGMVARG
jgi:phosphatidylglycerol lysyltransferase